MDEQYIDIDNSKMLAKEMHEQNSINQIPSYYKYTKLIILTYITFHNIILVALCLATTQWNV